MIRTVTKLSVFLSFVAIGLSAGASDSPPVPTPAAPTEAAVAGTNQPRIQFESPVFDFGKVNGGGSVSHEFIFTNTGTATLEITAVQPSCGCTAAGDWSKKVEPGQTGKIPVQFHSGSFSGQILKTVTVTSNDKSQPSVVLQIKGLIWKPVDVMPQYAAVQMTSETVSNAITTVRIVNNEEAPITLSPPECNNPFFTTELKTNQPGKEFTLTIRTAPPYNPRNTQGIITMKTSATNAPTVSVTAMAIMQPALVATPTQIMLPADPLDNEWTTIVTIRNQLNAALKLTEPRINPEQVKFELKETEPGRVYTVSITFPAGFHLDPSGPAQFSVKSSHTENPAIIIPIVMPPGKVSAGGATPISPRANQVVNATGAH